MFKRWENSPLNAKGLIFLLSYSLLSAILNYLNSVAQRNVVPGRPPLWVLIIGWTLIILFYVPIYIVFLHSVWRWGWSLGEWGFNLRGRAWISIGVAILGLIAVLFSSYFGSEESGFFRVGSIVLQRSVSFSLFQGYARVAEELLYRGFALILFQRLFPKSPRRSLWAVLFSSTCFTLVHTHKYNQPSTLVWLFVSSVLLAAIVLGTRSLALAFASHSALGGYIGMLYALAVYFGVAFFDERLKRVQIEAQSLRTKG